MARKEGWNVREALELLRGKMDPYLWEQGQELYRRNAVEDFAIQADGQTVIVQILDPRDRRKFAVIISKRPAGDLIATCKCPYRLHGYCRHQVVALEYLRAASEGSSPEGAADSTTSPGGGVKHATSGDTFGAGSLSDAPRRLRGEAASGIDLDEVLRKEIERLEQSDGSVIYALFDRGLAVKTRADGSLLRVIVRELGSSRKRHRVSVQLYTGTGFTELRTAENDRWIRRGKDGPHLRDALLLRLLSAGDEVRTQIDSESFAALLEIAAESDIILDSHSQPIRVSLQPWCLSARMVAGERSGLSVSLECRPATVRADTNEAPASPRSAAMLLEDVWVLPSTAPWIRLANGEFHPLASSIPGLHVERLQEEELRNLSGAALDRFLLEGVEALTRVCLGGIDFEPGLVREIEGVDRARIQLSGTLSKLGGRLELSYGGEWVDAPETPEPWTVEHEGEIRRYPPAGQSLARAAAELESRGFRKDGAVWTHSGPGVLRRVLERRPRTFVDLVLPTSLEAYDWVDEPPVLELEIFEGEGQTTRPTGGVVEVGKGGEGGGRASPVRRGSGMGWFEAGFAFRSGDRVVDVDLERLRTRLRDDPDGLVELGDGTVLSPKHESVRRLLELADSGGTGARSRSGRLDLSLATVAELLEPAPGCRVGFAAGISDLIRSLKQGGPSERVELDPAIDTTLRPYQKDAIEWFARLARWGLGGILADEMGLGKTLMTLTHFFGTPEADSVASLLDETPSESNVAPVLVVCPTSLVYNWIDECARFFPKVRAVGLYGVKAAERETKAREGADLIVTSYALLRRDREIWESTALRAVVLDEGQHIKNPESQTARAAFALDARERWVLTGTPIENHLGELWSLFRFLMPDFLDERAVFDERWSEPIRHGDAEAASRLRSRVRPFILRRTKEQVLSELPPRIEQVERVALSRAQQVLYEEYLGRARKEIEGGEGDDRGSRMKVLAALTRLRQICCHPALVLAEGSDDGDDRVRSGKFDLLCELLDECAEEGHRVLVFSQFTSMLDIIETRLRKEETRFARLDGSTRDREAEVKRFQTDERIGVFLISLKAGGHGLNLTQADTVIIYDPWWNPAAEEQAAARAHRMGQTLPVHVHKLVAADTVEEKILELQRRKSELARNIVGESEEGLSALSFDELRSVLYDA
jgi:superfamily II DNA or RNA helicase